MPDWTKRVAKERADDLLAGETLRAAIYFQGRGSTAGTVAGSTGGLLGAAAAHVATRGTVKKAEADAPESTLASALRAAKGVLAVTSDRIVVFGFKQGALGTKILDPIGESPISRLAGWSHSTGTLMWKIELAFDDGSRATIEIPRANKPSQFVETLGIPAG